MGLSLSVCVLFRYHRKHARGMNLSGGGMGVVSVWYLS